eukprot:3940797-Rhodomonas_salina.2
MPVPHPVAAYALGYSATESAVQRVCCYRNFCTAIEYSATECAVLQSVGSYTYAYDLTRPILLLVPPNPVSVQQNPVAAYPISVPHNVVLYAHSVLLTIR